MVNSNNINRQKTSYMVQPNLGQLGNGIHDLGILKVDDSRVQEVERLQNFKRVLSKWR